MRQVSEYSTKRVGEAIADLGALANSATWDPATHFGGIPLDPGHFGTPGELATKAYGLRGGDMRDYIHRVERQYGIGGLNEGDPSAEIDEWIAKIRSTLGRIDTAPTENSRLGAMATLDSQAGDLDYVLATYLGPPPVGNRIAPRKMTGPQTAQEAVTQYRQLMTDMGQYVEPPPISANPDVVRATQAFAQWSKLVLGQTMNAPQSATHAGLLQSLGVLDTSAASMTNKTEALMYDAVSEAMSRKWDDAYRLQYFAQTRSMLERSVNHPMFGIYPASYMWGKILPEMTRFVASEPFGVKTGAMAYAMLNVQKQIAIQSEFDPAFREKMESLGSNELLWMIGYMLPSVPWDVPSSFPMWMRSTAQRGLDAQSAVDAGAPQPDNTIQPVTMLTDALKPLDPARQVKQWTQPFKALGDNRDTPVQAEEPPKGAELGSTLEDIMQSLTDILSGH
jgi:hypothetical protein